METLRLKSKVGPFSFTDRVRIIHPSGLPSYEKKEFRFDLDNDLRQDVPVETWERLEDQWVDKTAGLKYKNAFRII